MIRNVFFVRRSLIYCQYACMDFIVRINTLSLEFALRIASSWSGLQLIAYLISSAFTKYLFVSTLFHHFMPIWNIKNHAINAAILLPTSHDNEPEQYKRSLAHGATVVSVSVYACVHNPSAWTDLVGIKCCDPLLWMSHSRPCMSLKFRISSIGRREERDGQVTIRKCAFQKFVLHAHICSLEDVCFSHNMWTESWLGDLNYKKKICGCSLTEVPAYRRNIWSIRND